MKPFAAASMIALGALALVRALRRRYFRVEVAGDSMRPTLLPGEYLLLSRAVPSAGRLGAGAIVLLQDATGRPILKRVVGLPGESLRVGTAVFVNRRRLAEPYAIGESPLAQHRGVNRLGEDEYFLIGDNREASTDSRDFGAVRHERIEGVVRFRYWPPRRVGPIGAPHRELGQAEASGELPLGMIPPRN
jgi:signal peptidase I